MTARAPSPYRGNAPRTYWRSAVSGRATADLEDLYSPRFSVSPSTRIATAGSCFAQHIARNLRRHGFSVIDAEPAPPGLSEANAVRFGYSTYSARYGNIYHVRQLLQLTQEALGQRTPEEVVWERDGRYYDALRPSVEPLGLDGPEVVAVHRARHLQHVLEVLTSCQTLVFTFGLTEAWVSRRDGTVYPTAPGTIAGSYDPAGYEFVNFGFVDLLEDFTEFRRLVHEINPEVNFLLTVSPVALAATASQEHVLVATAHSKATLRAVAGELFHRFADVDYFPSYEIITGVTSGNSFFDATLREVTPAGVDCVMSHFFTRYDAPPAGAAVPAAFEGVAAEGESSAVVCEDVLLEAFGP